MRLRFQRAARRPRLVKFVLSFVVAALAAIVSISTVSIFPPGLQRRDLEVAGAQTHLLVDAPPATKLGRTGPRSTILDLRSLPQDFATLDARALLLGDVLTTPPVVDRIAERMGVSPDAIGAYGAPDPNVPVALGEPGNEQRAWQLIELRRPYVLEIQRRPRTPMIDIYAQAPSPYLATRLAEAAVAGLRDYLTAVATARGDSRLLRMRLIEVEAPEGTMLSSGTKKIAMITFFAFFLITWGVVSAGIALLRRRRRTSAAGAALDDSEPPVGPDGRPRLRLPRRLDPNGGDWPRTTRVLPWMLAVFIGTVWLIPFDQITLSISFPISLPFDRLLLPFIIGLWVLAMATGLRGRPRIHFTPIHAAVSLFAVVAFLSVVLNAPELNHNSELMSGLKRVPLFASYLSLFVITASVVRRTEVRPFLTYTLWLALICAVGMIVQYRTGYNVFYDLPARVLPKIFSVGVAQGGFDSLGRRVVQGPAGEPLEAVMMLSLALPIALVRMMEATERGARVRYLLAACLLLAGMVTTFRKSGLLLPLSIIVTLAIFRPRTMLKMSPAGLVMLAAVHLAAPGAFGSITAQANNLNVPTVDDRIVRYDALHPDVWSHLAFGRGLGTFYPPAHRILDSEVLGRLVETGVLGLASFYLIMVATAVMARKVIRSSPDRWRQTTALIGISGAVSFAVGSAFYDTMSFPHGPYIFLYIAGFVAVVSKGVGKSAKTDADTPRVASVPASVRVKSDPNGALIPYGVQPREPAQAGAQGGD